MLRSLAPLVLLFPFALAAQIVSPNLELGPDRPVATPARVPDRSQLDSIVPDHGGFVVFWSRPSVDARGNTLWSLMARRVDNAGRQVTPDQEVLPAADRSAVSVARRKSGSFLFTWWTRDGIFIANASSDLSTVDEPARIASSGTAQVAVCNATACAAVWNDGTTTFASVISENGTSSTVALAATGSAYKLAAAGNGSTFAVAYGGAGAGFIAFDATGRIITNEQYDITASFGAAVAASPNGYVTAHTTWSGIRVTNKDVNGADIATRDVAMSFQPSDLALIPTPNDPVVIASEAISSGIVIEGSVPMIRLYVVNGTATPIDEEQHTDAYVTGATNGTSVLVGWTSCAFAYQPESGFYRVLDPAAPSVDQGTPLAIKDASQFASAIARSDDHELAVWAEMRLDGANLQAAVRPAGSNALAAPIVLESRTYNFSRATATTDGTGFAVLWSWWDMTGGGVHVVLLDAAGAVIHRVDFSKVVLVSNVIWFDGDYMFATYGKSVRLVRLSRDGVTTSTEIATKVNLGLALAPFSDRIAALYPPDLRTFYRIMDRDGSTISDQLLGNIRAYWTVLSANDGQALALGLSFDGGAILTWRFGADGTMRDAGPRQLDPYSSAVIPPTVLNAPAGWLVVWQRGDGSSAAAFVSEITGLPSTTFTIAPASEPISAVAVAANGTATAISTRAAADSAPVVVMRDLAWRSQPKRRAVH